MAKSQTKPLPAIGQRDTQGVLLLLVFIHGFKGSAETTFEDYPSRLAHILRETYPALSVETRVYPTYDTRGQLSTAVESFTEWLIALCVNLESKPLLDEKSGRPKDPKETGRGGGAGSVKVILCGHSMGGLVAADAALSIANEGGLRDGKLWPRVCAVLAYDTPYLGVHPAVFKHSVDKYSGYVKVASDVSSALAPFGAALGASLGFGAASTAAGSNRSNRSGSSGWGRWATTGAAALAAGAAGAGLYASRGTLGSSYTWISSHLDFVGTLWDRSGSDRRIEELGKLEQVLFHCYYTRLGPTSNAVFSSGAGAANAGTSRVFIILPPADKEVAKSFTPCVNTRAKDEVDAHISMFNPMNNDDYYRMGQVSALVIGRSLASERMTGTQSRSQRETDADEPPPDRMQGSRQGDPEILAEQEAQKVQLQEEANAAAEEADKQQEERDREMERRRHLEALERGTNERQGPSVPPEEPSPWA
ncbi:hypothetical protein K437DRAFT_259383 [Tilletiaria anomala UBC 951]|uniref:DUF676 domain-containing protein n=1 Tax=Tilletiaria anomala (strain ATCC 24038 / CBS 436.72 / UBC 951) TaxID=1037660 RepID=A0A066VIV7_TILAU|nr:uncharacterized protein K437DRAFT_259383 [Tilletiaria anomala UBC 951]KDN38520.1 hypothetical protein K437DRAFT_259383 [Tilletiaria anomala UBC 951]